MKDAGLRIRVQRELRQSFLETCKAEDKSAAQVLREFMRSYIKQRAETSTERVQREKISEFGKKYE